MNLKPLFDRVMLKQSDADSVTKGGIHLPDNAKEKPTKGEVLAVGPGKRADDGTLIEPTVKVGDKVLYERYGGVETEIDGEKYVVVRENEIIAVIN